MGRVGVPGDIVVAVLSVCLGFPEATPKVQIVMMSGIVPLFQSGLTFVAVNHE